MKNCIPCPTQLRILLMGAAALLCFNLFAKNGPNTTTSLAAPFFIDAAPADTTVSCIGDVPIAPTLTADDDFDPSFPKEVVHVDSPLPGSLDGCSTVAITRTWTVMDDEMLSASVMQTITVLADTDPPFVGLPEVKDTVACEMADYTTWIDTRRLEVSVNIFGANPTITDNCSMLMVSDDAPATFDNQCGTLVVTFTITDACGNSALWTAEYTVEDNQGPELIGIPASMTGNNAMDCSTPIPNPPIVTAIDNCTTPSTITFSSVSTQVMNGSCSEFEYTVTRTWSVSDECGNVTDSIQIIEVIDNLSPSFTAPPDVVIECSDDPDDLGITGDVVNEADNCDQNLVTTYSDIITPGSCPQEFTIERTWRVRDTCGNVTGKVQTILVTDSQAPTFTVPADIVIDCSQVNDMSVTGEPTNVMDNCDTALDTSSVDFISNMTCQYSYVIRRVWSMTDDCGNFTELEQFITVTDDIAPSFTAQAVDISLDCVSALDIETVFDGWVAAFGNAAAVDNCSADSNLVWSAVNSGTSDIASLPSANCPAMDSIVRMQVVDFIVEDECGNRDTSTASFIVTDLSAPVLRNCPTDTTIITDVGECYATYSFAAPIIEDDCALALMTEDISASGLLTSSAAPGDEEDTPVDPLNLDLMVTNPLPVNAFGNGTLTISLINADAAESTEFFNILGEDGTIIGQTAIIPTPTQCGSSDTTLTITANQINSWGSDGIITIRLEPNIPTNQPGDFAVNDICGGSLVNANLTYTAKDLTGIRYEYSLNNGPRVNVSPIGQATTTVEKGENLITYYATDCAGNVDSCSYMITVEDQEPPVLGCPADITVSLEPDLCTAQITLPLPASATDNCGVGTMISSTLPSDTAAAFFTFSFDPNLTDYLADDKVFEFTNVAANAMEDVELIIEIQGDFNSNGAFLTIKGDDDSTIGNTNVGDADCSTANQILFSIPAALFNTWAGDGIVNITAEVNDIPVPPGVPGDGVNPCNPALVTANGDIDSVGYIFATINYKELTPSYFATGATTFPTTAMMAPTITPTLEFDQGLTEVSYIVLDENANPDTCSYTVTVEDNQNPTALCQPTTIFINPSGLLTDTVQVAEIDAGSTDNCGIDTMFLSPNTFTCEQAGTTVFATLAVTDLVGNTASCSVPVRIETLKPEPTYSTGVCTGDSLYLFANPPEAIGGIIYTYVWTGPNNFMSFDENPVIPNIQSSGAGTYIVEVTGITGCTAEGIVQVPIEISPTLPMIQGETNICTTEDIVLTSSVIPSASAVSYFWYDGDPQLGGILISTTSGPSLTIPGPQNEGTRNFFLQIEADGCSSPVSTSFSVTSTELPIAVTNDQNIEICEGESITLGTFVSGEGITYEWTGPDEYFSTAQFPPVIDPATLAADGVYRLIVYKNGCPSDPAFTIVNITPKPETPLITNNGPVCRNANITITTNIDDADLYTWHGPNFQEITTTIPSLSIHMDLGGVANSAGEWQLVVTEDGCESDFSNTTNLEVFPLPDAIASVNPVPVCEGGEVELQAGPNFENGAYQWSGPNDFSSVAQNPVINAATFDMEGTYEVTVTSDDGCTSTATIEVDVLEAVSVVAISNNASACLDGPTDIKLIATVFPEDDGSYQYSWTGPNGFMSSDSCAIIPNATEEDNGNYQLVVTTQNGFGCSSEMANTIVDTSNPPATPDVPEFSESTPGPSYCEGEMLMLTCDAYAGTNVIYNWVTTTPNGTIQTTTPSLVLNDLTTANSGMYSVFVTVNGCPSNESGTLAIAVGAIPSVTATSNDTICNGEVIELLADFIPGATYEWVGPSGFTSAVFNPIIEPANEEIHSGPYCVIATVNGCESSLACVNVLVSPTPEVPLADNNGPVCVDDAGAVLSLVVQPSSATPGASYTWLNEDDQEIGTTTSVGFNLANPDSFEDGTYDFRVYAELDGCRSANSIPTELVVNTIPINTAFAGNDTTYCENDMIELIGEFPSVGTGQWTQTEGDSVRIANPDEAQTSLNGLVGGQSYTFQWTLSNGACLDYSSDVVTLEVNQLDIPEAGEDQTVCESDIVNLGAVPSELGGIWSQSSTQTGLGIEIVDPTNPGSEIIGFEPGNIYEFIWTITGGCGEEEDVVTILVSDPFPFGGQDTTICNDEGEIQLNATPPTDGSRGEWRSDDPNLNFTDAEDPKTVVMGLRPGENVLIWEIDEGICEENSRDTIRVFYKEHPIAVDDEVLVNFGEVTEFNVLINDDIPPGSTVTLLTEPRVGSIEVIDANGSFSYTPNFDFVGLDEITYEVSSSGCVTSTATVTLLVGENAACKVPSIFTPNNDGINDFFVIPCLLDVDLFPESRVTIFNQWGDEVYRSSIPYPSNWDGTYNGTELPEGTYFYIVEYGINLESESGYVLIYR